MEHKHYNVKSKKEKLYEQKTKFLIFKNIKNYINEKGMYLGKGMFDTLNNIMKGIIDNSIESAKANKRKVVSVNKKDVGSITILLKKERKS